MRYFWGGLSLVAFVVAVILLLLTVSGHDYTTQALGGAIAIVALLTAYFARRISRRYSAA